MLTRHLFLRATLFSVTLAEFRDSLAHDSPPSGLTLALTGLWWDAKGDWSRAHESAQQDDGPDGAWVHAYLHRKEGDVSNASYWYSRARKRSSSLPLNEEWQQIAAALIQP